MRIQKHLATAVALGMAANFAMADTYQTELKVDYGHVDYDTSGYDSDGGTVTGKLYFQEVELKNFVYGEAAFLNRASNISVSYSQDEYKVDENFPAIDAHLRTKTTDRVTSADVEFYVPNTPLYIAGGVADFKSRIRGWERLGNEETRIRENIDPSSYWYASLGITPIDGLLIATDFYEDDDIKDRWTLRTKYVADMGGKAVNFEAGYEYYYGEDVVNAAVDLYLSRSFSIGATYEYYEDSEWDDVWGVRARQFFSNHFSIDVGYSKWDDNDVYTAGVGLRF